MLQVRAAFVGDVDAIRRLVVLGVDVSVFNETLDEYENMFIYSAFATCYLKFVVTIIVL